MNCNNNANKLISANLNQLLPRTHQITWGISRYSKHLSTPDQLACFSEVFMIWQNAFDDLGIPITFVNTLTETPTINIRFMSNGTPGLPEPFSDNTLGYAFYPDAPEPLKSDIYFNEAYNWAYANILERQVLLKAAGVHEVGHALGVPHTDDPLDVMFATFDNVERPIGETTLAVLMETYGDLILTSDAPVESPVIDASFNDILSDWFTSLNELNRMKESTLVKMGVYLNLEVSSKNKKADTAQAIKDRLDELSLLRLMV